ncbi:gamma-glutamyl-gamma-aminobutyrate hydrolase family protein [Phaeobacter inhibens]|uniref:gamma-glutamyl-gamma-aminobutyrate hydrolase family protein n=1 Tax=Phaeobacter inhibens TaxID=221822 RepID=UPI0021A7F7FF|nr:type 1 glutamine amidotransferase [Phaeobacter inhibens]UWR87792.1 type 1 glutamine amidotransferase [Phaeobacter inhibens]
MKPVIAVTVSRRSGWRIFPLMALNIWLAGGRAVRWQSGRAADLAQVDGVVIGGGDDIAPTLYKGQIMPEVRLDPDRDALEADIVRQATQQDVPLLGICRGAQMLNVARGGALYQDAYAFYGLDNYKTVLPRKKVTITNNSTLRRILGVPELKVNALHSQSVSSLGQGLRVTGRDQSGMVQAIEDPGRRFAVGVQWHPEHLFYQPAHLNLFRALVEAARSKRDDPVEALDMVG